METEQRLTVFNAHKNTFSYVSFVTFVFFQLLCKNIRYNTSVPLKRDDLNISY